MLIPCILLSAIQLASAGQLTPAGNTTSTWCVPQASNEGRVTVPGVGQFHGRVDCQHRAFLGLPYALPPVSRLRWRPPEPVPASDGLVAQYNCTQWRPSCVQLRSERLGEVGRLLVGVKEESEDCLYLNIFTPRPHTVKQKSGLPVLVFIHGGAFSTGGSSAPLYNPVDLMVNGFGGEAVVVTFDYRLGVFGFAAGEPLLNETDDPVGNYGLQDQMAALTWIRDHIAHFNGDPDNITVMGHSAGAMAASYLQLLAPQLADKWVLLSGTSFGWKWRHAGSPFETQVWTRIAEGVGCDKDDVECVRSKPASEIAAVGVSFRGDFLFGPTVDNRLLLQEPIHLQVPNSNNNNKQIGPTIVTVVKDEASLFLGSLVRTPADFERTARSFFPDAHLLRQILTHYTIAEYGTAFSAANAAITDAMFTCPALRYAEHLRRHSSTTVHFAQFEHAMLLPSFATVLTSGRDYGVFHGSDLVLLFNFSPFVTLPAAREAKEMREGLLRFMRTGSPLEKGLIPGEDSVWTANSQVQFRGQCQSVWGLLRGQPPLPQNFGSTLPTVPSQ